MIWIVGVVAFVSYLIILFMGYLVCSRPIDPQWNDDDDDHDNPEGGFKQ